MSSSYIASTDKLDQNTHFSELTLKHYDITTKQNENLIQIYGNCISITLMRFKNFWIFKRRRIE